MGNGSAISRFPFPTPDLRFRAMTGPRLLVADLGVMPYVDALELQRAVARARISGAIAEDVLLLVEHPPVVTLGRSTKARNLITPTALLAARGVELHEVERGGDVTFHGPGQLVGYPIVDLKRHRRDLHWYLRQVEESLIRGLALVGVAGERNAGYTGVWVAGGRIDSPRKLASIGVHARDWVTWHGFALNVTTDLTYFDLIVPCGISGVTMTSVAAELRPRACDARAVRDAVVRGFESAFSLDAAETLPAAISAAAEWEPARSA
jgi:lipoyl(octanoyl) transferase